MSSIDAPASFEDGRWHELDRLFDRALELPAEEREAFVAAECSDDLELLAELRTLLATHEESTSFLTEPPLFPRGGLNALADEVDAPSARIGERIGAWRVIDEIGRGGMATVYRAERVDCEFEQEGALKLLRRGLDTDDLVGRFRAERQILSSLDHPNIAGLLDGGATSDGRPYLVMERVDGIRITEWCDDRGCTVEERLRLFLAVARAVHHAHGRLVVHRDLKPSNILVTSDGHVKLLDFGIAKLIDPDLSPDDPVRTRSGQRALTPEYASPEQLRGDPVTTATDIYQLGLLLHQLLSGARPRDVRGSGEENVSNGERLNTTLPTPPSRVVAGVDAKVSATRGVSRRRLEQRLRGDLDTIVVTALRPEVEARYGSALEMARDVEKHLDGLPIAARPPNLGYRARKFLSRHPWVAPVAVAIVGVIGLYVATLLRHSSQLEAERNAARQQAERAEVVRNELVDVFQGASPWLFEPLPRSGQATLEGSLAAGVDRTRALERQPEIQIDLYTVLAGAYMGLGHPERARPLVREGLRLRAEVDGPRSASVAAGLRQLGRALATQARYDSAAVVLGSGLDVLRELPAAPDTMLLGTLIDLAWVEKLRGHPETAERLLTEVAEAALADSAIPRDFLVQAYFDLAIVYPRMEEYARAREVAERAVELQRSRFGDEHPETAIARAGLAGVLWRTSHEDFGRAVELQRQAAQSMATTLGPEHPHTLTAHIKLALTMRSDGQIDDAADLLHESVARHRELFGPLDPRTGQAHHWYATVLYNRGDLEEARVQARLGYAALSHAAAGTPGLGVGENVILLCGIAIHLDDHSAALNRCREATEVFAGAGMQSGNFNALAECRLGHVLTVDGRHVEAEALFDRAVPVVWRARTVFFPGYVHECLNFAIDTYEHSGRADEVARLRALAERTSRRGLPGVAR